MKITASNGSRHQVSDIRDECYSLRLQAQNVGEAKVLSALYYAFIESEGLSIDSVRRSVDKRLAAAKGA